MIPLQFPRQLLLSIFGLVWFWFVSLTNFSVYSRKIKFFFYLLLGCFQGGFRWKGNRDRTVKQYDGEWRWNNTGKCSWDLGSAVEKGEKTKRGW